MLTVIKIGICALKLDGELYRVSLEILLHDFLTFRIFYIASSKDSTGDTRNISNRVHIHSTSSV